MKANAPEKIWVHELSAMELNVPLKECHVEYTRTDVFVEKVCDFLKENASDYFKVDWFQHEWYFERDQLIKCFKKYMKGE